MFVVKAVERNLNLKSIKERIPERDRIHVLCARLPSHKVQVCMSISELFMERSVKPKGHSKETEVGL